MAEAPTHEDRNTRVWYLRTAGSSGGEVHEQRVEYRPGSPFPPTHFHPEQDEHWPACWGGPCPSRPDGATASPRR